MKLLILGSEGFIGSNAEKYFSDRGYEVYTADITLKEKKNYQIINPEHINFTSLFSTQKFDFCINATGAANVQFSFHNPGLDYSLNVSNVYLMLDAIRQSSPGCRFINLSSAAVYGNPSRLPIEETALLEPLSPYGRHKLYSEQICNEFYYFYNIPTVSLRIFSAYGPGLRKQLFWDLYNKLTSGDNEVTLWGTGRESRDFIYIDDLLLAIECIMKHCDFKGQAINVSSGVENTIAEAVNIFRECLGVKTSISFNNEEKVGDPKNWRADISILSSMGFEPRSGLSAGLQNYAKWVKELQ
jgi:UDP-glucose 4-epimerase